MNELNAPRYATGSLELNFWGDFRQGIVESVNACKSKPVLALILVGLCALDAINTRIPGLGLVEEMLVIFLSYSMIRAEWAKMNAQTTGFRIEDYKGAEVKMVGVAISYGLLCFLFGLLLVVPGVWWGVRSSLAMIFAALEKCSPRECFKRSHELVKGSFWRVFRYVFGGPLFAFLLLIGFYYLILLAAGLSKDHLPPGVDFCAGWMMSVATSLFQLAVTYLLIRMYAYLKRIRELQADPMANMDPKFNRRW